MCRVKRADRGVEVAELDVIEMGDVGCRESDGGSVAVGGDHLLVSVRCAGGWYGRGVR